MKDLHKCYNNNNNDIIITLANIIKQALIFPIFLFFITILQQKTAPLLHIITTLQQIFTTYLTLLQHNFTNFNDSKI